MDEVARLEESELALTERDAIFVAEKTAGRSAIDALLAAYDDDPEVASAVELTKSTERKDRELGKLMLRRMAYNTMRRRGIRVLTEKYVERMQQMGDVALDTLEELMIEGSSEKVRADVAIEVARHNLGNPDKDKNDGHGAVIVVIGEPPKDLRNMSDVYREKQQMGTDYDYNQIISDAADRRQSLRDAAIEAEIVDERKQDI